MTAPRLVLHIGAMKTGTTYLQNLLQLNRAVLQEQGWIVPPKRSTVRGVREVMGLTDQGQSAIGSAPEWDALTERIRCSEDRGTVLSMEFLSYAKREGLSRVMGSLAGVDVHVVLTVRDAAGALPSQWQSLSRNGGVISWPDFATTVRSAGSRDKTPAVRAFRRTQDVTRMLEVWSHAVPKDRLTVITVPPSSAPRTLLWERLLSVVGIDPVLTSTDAAFDNPRLGYGACELLRRLNAAGLADERPSSYRRVVRFVSRNHLLPLVEGQSRPRLDRATADFAVALNGRTRAAIQRRANLVGDLDDLPVSVAETARLDDGPAPRQVPDDEVRGAAEAAWAGAVAYCAENEIALPAGTRSATGGDLDEAVARLVELLRLAIAGDPSHGGTSAHRL